MEYSKRYLNALMSWKVLLINITQNNIKALQYKLKYKIGGKNYSASLRDNTKGRDNTLPLHAVNPSSKPSTPDDPPQILSGVISEKKPGVNPEYWWVWLNNQR